MLAITLVGCAGRGLAPRSVSLRFIETDPGKRFHREFVIESSPFFTWEFRSESDLEDWHVNVESAERSVSAGGLHLRPSHGHVTLTREVDFRSSLVDAFELRVRGLRRHAVVLEWAGPGEEFSADRRVQLELGRDAGDGFRKYRLVTAGHLGWRGRITKLRFGLVLPRHRRAQLDRIVAVDEVAPADRLVTAARTPWRVELDMDVRSALLAVPGEPIGRELDVPEGAELHVGYAVYPSAPVDVHYRIVAERPNRPTIVLFETTVKAGSQDWNDMVVDLAELSGSRVRLELVTATDGPYDLVHGFPVWSNPEVTGRRSSDLTNIVLISIDTLRADHLSLYGYPRITSPHIDAWAASRGTVFESVVASAPWTLPSHVSMFTGLHAHRHGVNHNLTAPSDLATMAEILRSAGYATVAVTGGGFVHPQYGLAQGFDSYRSVAVRLGQERELEIEVDQACSALERYADRPFFLFFHTYEVHNPFRPRQPYFAEYGDHPSDVLVSVETVPPSADDGFMDHRRYTLRRRGKNLGELPSDQLGLAVDLYDAGIAYTDAMVARLLRRLEHLGIDHRTIVVLTSDHGEMLGEHGVFNHVSLYEENLLVPLVIVDPTARSSGSRVREQVRLVDLLPTILERLGLRNPPGIDGVSLLPLLSGGALPPEAGFAWSYAPASNYGLAVRERNRLKYTVRNTAFQFAGEVEQLFDLSSDPTEEHGRTTNTAELKRLRALAAGELRDRTPGVKVGIYNSGGQEALVGRLAAQELYATRVKTLQPGCRCLTYGPRNEAHFSVAPGERIDVVLEDVGRFLTVDIVAAGPSDREFTAEIDLSRLEGVRRVVRTAGGWREVDAREPAVDGISVWWHLRADRDSLDPVELDESLRQQLEALGYAE